jgi:hypothetical protein
VRDPAMKTSVGVEIRPGGVRFFKVVPDVLNPVTNRTLVVVLYKYTPMAMMTS